MAKYLVWFEQVNADMIEVDAGGIEEAKLKAKKEWLLYNTPIIVEVKEVNPN